MYFFSLFTQKIQDLNILTFIDTSKKQFSTEDVNLFYTLAYDILNQQRILDFNQTYRTEKRVSNLASQIQDAL